jgi:hypothetical protein
MLKEGMAWTVALRLYNVRFITLYVVYCRLLSTCVYLFTSYHNLPFMQMLIIFLPQHIQTRNPRCLHPNRTRLPHLRANTLNSSIYHHLTKTPFTATHVIQGLEPVCASTF